MIEPPEVPHQHGHHEGAPRRGLAKWFFEAVMPVSVLLMSIGSLYVALHTGAAMDKLVAHNEKLVKAQSTPILEYDASNYDLQKKKGSLSFKLNNVGTGPAQLKWVRLRDGDRVHAHFGPWLKSQVSEAESEAMNKAGIITGGLDDTVLPARDSRLGLLWEQPDEEQTVQRAVWERINTERHRLRISYCYCSVFDECWQANGGTAQPVARCEAAPAPTADKPAASAASAP